MFVADHKGFNVKSESDPNVRNPKTEPSPKNFLPILPNPSSVRIGPSSGRISDWMA